mgnify:FL=1
MTLNEYLKRENIAISRFAAKCGLNQPTFWRIVKGKNRPSAASAIAIERATGGAVSLRELLSPAEELKSTDETA